jgi:MYXO-CTERM domain-containing protein
VVDSVRHHFGEFYASLFDRTLQMNPGAIVTEYAWDAGTCDPCPGPQIDDRDLLTLGNDQLSGQASVTTRRGARASGNFVLTRLHARYDANSAPNDLVFRAAAPITGGRSNDASNTDHGSSPSSYNNFQGRYIIKHDWVGEITCSNPVRGRWGGPPSGVKPENTVATKIAFAPRGTFPLWNAVEENVPEVKLEKAVAYAIPQEPPKRSPRVLDVAEAPHGEFREPPPPPTPMGVSPHRCGCAAGPLTGPSAFGLLALVGAVGLAIGRRRR